MTESNVNSSNVEALARLAAGKRIDELSEKFEDERQSLIAHYVLHYRKAFIRVSHYALSTCRATDCISLEVARSARRISGISRSELGTGGFDVSG